MLTLCLLLCTFSLGRIPRGRVSGIDLQFTLPEDVYACDMAVFTIWCDAADVHFTSIDIPPDIFVNYNVLILQHVTFLPFMEYSGEFPII